MEEKVHFNDFLVPNYTDGTEGYSNHLIILNSKSFSPKLTVAIWHNCKYKICADGGANRLFDSLDIQEREKYIPDFIIGDLDSVRNDVVHFYQERGCAVKKISSQNEHDLDKSILLLRSLIESGTSALVDSLDQEAKITVQGLPPAEPTASREGPAALSLTSRCCVVVMGAYGGRFDQEMAAVSSLFRWLPVFDRVLLLGAYCTASLLQPGVTHRIRCVNHANPAEQTNAGVVREGPTCGLIPVGGRVNSITTTGLQWDLHGQALEMGVFISSSNHLRPDAAEVTVQTSDTVLWTVELLDV